MSISRLPPTAERSTGRHGNPRHVGDETKEYLSMPDGWFRRKQSSSAKRSLQARVQAIPEGLFTPCPRCRELLLTRELEKNFKVCKKCHHHLWLTAEERI